MTTTMPSRRDDTGQDDAASSNGKAAHGARDLEREIDEVRGEMSILIGELDRRRHELTDVKLQVRRHPLAAGIVAAAGALAIAAMGVRLYRALRPRTRGERARTLAHALRLIAEDPDKLLAAVQQRPTPGSAVLSSLLSAGTKAAARAVTP